jgi:hypothetical protein
MHYNGLAAETAASNGDTLLNTWHRIKLMETLHLTKPGWLLIGAGEYQNTAFTNHNSYIPNFYLDKNANGAKLIGMDFGSIECVGNASDTINNILIEECYIGTIIRNFSSTISNYIPWTNVTIRNCHF